MSEGAAGEDDGSVESQPDFSALLIEIKNSVIAAHAWLLANDPDWAPALNVIVGILEEHTLHVSDALGEAGFDRDRERRTITFNSATLASIWSVAGQVATACLNCTTTEQVAKVRRASLELYVLHETFHLVQNFEKHELAKVLKSAFGPDELSKFDLVADIAAVNCVTLTALARPPGFEADEYLRLFGANVLLAYELLCRGFKTAGVPHKKKRALGLLTSLALVRLSLETNEPTRRERLRKLATAPAYTSIDAETDFIIALTCCANPGGWAVLFSASAPSDTIEHLWADPGDASPERALGVLVAAYRGAVFTPE